jgi:uncharacterized RDD family membrane protein YckC
VEDTRYKTFWRRFGANLIDGFLLSFAALVILVPIIVLVFFASMDAEGGEAELSLAGVLLMFGIMIALQVCIHAYTILMLWKYGQTVGKMATGIVVRRADSGAAIGFREAVLRSSGEIGLQLLYLLIVAAGASAVTSDEAFEAMNNGHAAIGPCWWLAELVTMLTNSRRRALHDLIAGTVVTKKSFEAPTRPVAAPAGAVRSGW